MSSDGSISPPHVARRNGVTVIVPTYNRKRLLAMTLESLARQDIGNDRFEVIVVDDGSSDGTRDVTDRYKDRFSLSYYFQRDSGFRAAAARNVGLKHAHFDVVLFIDSGILASSRLVRLHLDAHRLAYPVAILGLSYGVVEREEAGYHMIPPLLADGVDVALERLKHVPSMRDCRALYLESIDYDLSKMALPWLICWTGHLSVSTRLLLRLGGFDEWFTRWGGEDVELGLRLFQMGCRFRVLSAMESIHYPHAKDPVRMRQDALINARYIHRKHRLRETELLAYHEWEFIEVVERLKRHQLPLHMVHAIGAALLNPAGGTHRQDVRHAEPSAVSGKNRWVC